MCNEAVDNYVGSLEYVPEYFKIQEMCDKAVDIYPSATQFVPECFKLKKCVIKLLILVLLYFILFLIDIRLGKCVTKFFLKIDLIDRKLNKTQMCNKVTYKH